MSPNKRSVRFNESTTDQPAQKRSRQTESRENKEAPGPSVLRPSSHKVKDKNRDRLNEDELDDIDDWNEQEDGDPNDGDNGARLPTQSQLNEAKRKRREQREASIGMFNEKDAYCDENEASLARDGVKIEPFHMREEETDGTGYFDGDTYVFRKNVPEDGEADAWADSLMRGGSGNIEDDNEDRPAISMVSRKGSREETKSSNRQEDLDDLSKEQLYKRIVPLLGDSVESIMEAIRRYGKLARTNSDSKNRRKKEILKQQENNKNQKNIAKSNLNALTGAANALLLKGEVDIYDRTRQDIFRLFPSLSVHLKGDIANSTIKASIGTSKPKWEYQGNEDSQLHGPFTTEQMIAWVRSGYFLGTQRVKIRTVNVQEQADEQQNETQLSTEDDLLADLMDDEEEEEEESRPAKKAKDSHSTTTIKGQWMWSNEIDYQKYL